MFARVEGEHHDRVLLHTGHGLEQLAAQEARSRIEGEFDLRVHRAVVGLSTWLHQRGDDRRDRTTRVRLGQCQYLVPRLTHHQVTSLGNQFAPERRGEPGLERVGVRELIRDHPFVGVTGVGRLVIVADVARLQHRCLVHPLHPPLELRLAARSDAP